MFNPQYCCCAIPLVNAGIYTLLTEQLVLSLLAGVLGIATPTIVGGHVPTFTPYIFSALCFIVAALQIIGFFGIFKEKTRLFRAYSLMNALSFGAVFAISAALIIVSALNHKNAVTTCENTYFTGITNSTTTSTATSGEGSALCEAFAWADVGIMGGLWVTLFIVQTYLIFMTRVYSTEQAEDHKKYRSIYSTNVDEYMMADRASRYNADAWDHRPSTESIRNEPGNPGSDYYNGERYAVPYTHQRDTSTTSMLPEDAMRYDDDPRYRKEGQYEYDQEHMEDPRYANASGGEYMEYPEGVMRGRDPEATPRMGEYSDSQAYARRS